MGLGIGELLIVLAIVLIIFGAGKLPDLGDGIGRSIKNFRRAVKSDEIDVTPRSRDRVEDREKPEEDPPKGGPR